MSSEPAQAVTSQVVAARRLEPTYPDQWIRAWSDVLWNAPGKLAMPRIDVIHVKAQSYTGPVGKYLPGTHTVRVFARDNDRFDALATLVHELAHAWAPHERAHHGEGWRVTFAKLIEWLTGYEFDLARLPTRTREIRDAVNARERVGNNLMAFVMDSMTSNLLADIAPTIWYRLDEDGKPRAVETRIGTRHHCFKVRT